MGLRGPGAKPKELRVLEGTAQRVSAIATTTAEALTPEMTEDARDVWDDVVATFPPNYFKSADRWHLAAYCEAVASWQHAHAKVGELGEVVEQVVLAKDGKSQGVVLKTNPWLRVLNGAHARMLQLGDRLGIGPARRTLSVEATNRNNRTPAPQSQPPAARTFFRPASKD